MAESGFEQFGPASPAGLADFVPVAFADGLEQAARLRELLEKREIPTLIETEDPRPIDRPEPSDGVPVLVPAEMFDEATEVLASVPDDDSDEFEPAYSDEEEEEGEDEEFDDDYEDEDFDDFDDEDDDDLFYDDEDEDEDV